MKRKISTNSRVISDILADYSNTFIAFCELINNSIQANSKNIRIMIDQVAPEEVFPTPIRSIEIVDDGFGVPEFEFDKKILQIGTDVKKGGRGVGRFAALQIGSTIKIETVSYDKTKDKYTKVILPISFYNKPSKLLTEWEFETTEEILNEKYNSFYKVLIEDIYDSLTTEKDKKKKIDKNLLLENIGKSIFERYPSQIFNEDINVYINENKINKDEYVIGEPEFFNEEYTDLKGEIHKVELNFYNIKTEKDSIKLFLTVENSGIRTVAGMLEYSADWLSPKIGSWFIYIYSNVFTINFLRNLDVMELDEEQKALKKFIKEKVDDFFKEKNKDYEDFSIKLKEDSYYPYKDKEASSSSKEHTFEKIAYLLEHKYNLIKKSESIREIIYPLIDRSISNGDIQSIIKSILKLDDEYIQKFNELLTKTDLESVIEFSESVANKTHFLDFLFKITYGEPSKYLKERSQLHKIIEKNIWIFGEQYSRTPYIALHSDKNLENILNKMREEHFMYEPTSTDENLIDGIQEELNNIIDLFFYNEKILDDERREIMIVELKAPKCKINQKELNQIDRYHYHIERNAVFTSNRHYKLILISSEISDFAKSQIGQIDPQKPFLYKKSKSKKDIESWVIVWSDLIEFNKRKLSFLGDALKTKDEDVVVKFEKEFKEIEIENIKKRKSKLSVVRN